MEVTAWNDGKHSKSGSGYGLKISKKDIDKYFNKEWKEVYLTFPNSEEKIVINIDKKSFWNNCREFINKGIGIWLINNGYAPWEKGKPPKFILIKEGKCDFILEATNS